MLDLFPPADGEATTSACIAAELERFDDHLRHTCGLAPLTCTYRCRHVAAFLARCFGDAPLEMGRLAADDIDAFLKGLAARWQPASRKVICTSLRSYFRFRTLLGDDTRTLSASLPAIANWPRRHPPKVLTDSQIEHFLHAFDRTDPVGLRDHAIARCLLDLGLRGDEATHLTLDDLDWRNGTVTLHRTKSQRVQHLPLPVQTGEALAHYLREGRPQTESRVLFILETAVGRACWCVWAGVWREATTRQAHACKAERQSQAPAQACQRVCSAGTLRVSVGEGTIASVHAVLEIAKAVNCRF